MQKNLDFSRFFSIFFLQSIDKWKKIGYNKYNLKLFRFKNIY